MRTESQRAASRINGAKSRGPITPEGKTVSSMNSLGHGILANSLVLDSESEPRFQALLQGLIRELEPQTGIELSYVENMAVCRWRQMRIWILEKTGLDHEISKSTELDVDISTRASLALRHLCDTSKLPALMNRYEARFDRHYSRSLRDFYQSRLLRKQADRM
jgi:hypothetical protein